MPAVGLTNGERSRAGSQANFEKVFAIQFTLAPKDPSNQSLQLLYEHQSTLWRPECTSALCPRISSQALLTRAGVYLSLLWRQPELDAGQSNGFLALLVVMNAFLLLSTSVNERKEALLVFVP